jgi:hypothetical protein
MALALLTFFFVFSSSAQMPQIVASCEFAGSKLSFRLDDEEKAQLKQGPENCTYRLQEVSRFPRDKDLFSLVFVRLSCDKTALLKSSSLENQLNLNLNLHHSSPPRLFGKLSTKIAETQICALEVHNNKKFERLLVRQK